MNPITFFYSCLCCILVVLVSKGVHDPNISRTTSVMINPSPNSLEWTNFSSHSRREDSVIIVVFCYHPSQPYLISILKVVCMTRQVWDRLHNSAYPSNSLLQRWVTTCFSGKDISDPREAKNMGPSKTFLNFITGGTFISVSVLRHSFQTTACGLLFIFWCCPFSFFFLFF